MIVMLSVIELKNRFAPIKLASSQDASLLKLGQHPINGGEPNINLVVEQRAVDILSTQVSFTRLAEHIENF
jgi:hypothetical protein